MDWISLKDQHPVYAEPVLVCGEGNVAIARLYSVTHTADGITFVFRERDSGWEELWFTPTHFIRIPPEPEPEEK